MDPAQMRSYVEGFSLSGCKLGSQGYQRVLLQLFGFLGQGKSSFINSCKYVLDGDFKVLATLGDFQHVGTVVRTSYRLTDTVTMVDNRGLSTASSHENVLIYAQLGNLMHLDKRVSWPKNYLEIMNWVEDGDNDPNYTDFVVPVFIYSVTMTMREHEVLQLREILNNAETLTGIKPFVVLTKKSSGQLTKVESMFRDMGINHVFQLENYIPEKHDRVCATDDEILTFLYRVLRDVECRMEKKRNLTQERTERKKFVLKFAHEKELEKEKEKARAESKPSGGGESSCEYSSKRKLSAEAFRPLDPSGRSLGI